MRLVIALAVAALAMSQSGVQKVGHQDDHGFLPSGHVVRGAGQFRSFAGRPVDAVATADGKTLYVKDQSAVRSFDVAKWEENKPAALEGGASLAGIALSPDEKHLAVSNAGNAVRIYSTVGDLKLETSYTIPGASPFPIGLAYSAKGDRLYVAASKANQVAEIDTASGKVLRTVDVGVAPYGLALLEGRLFVTEQGGPRAKAGEETSPSADTPTVVDARGVALRGSVSIVRLGDFKVERQVVSGRQPSAIVADARAKRVYVTETNDDRVLVLGPSGDTLEKIEVKPVAGLPFGSMPDALGLSPDGTRLFVALAGNNAVAVYQLSKTAKFETLLPTDWYPTAVVATRGEILVVNNKGLGSRTLQRDAKKGWNSHDAQGTVRKVKWTDYVGKKAAWTAQAKKDALSEQTAELMATKPRPGVKAVAVPERTGEPSLIKHVVYVIKENRTYDQVFGDIGRGDSDPSLCVFGRQVTPNQHKLADEFVLLDNYYCNGVLSADGHSYATEGNLTPYLNRAFGGFTRSYTFGDDPITYSSSGFVWDALIDKGLWFRNYGEFHYTEPAEKLSGKEIWDRYVAGKTIPWTHKVGVARVLRNSNSDCPGWNMNIPDQLRMDVFLKEFEQFKKRGTMPDFCVLYLPQDHTGGAVSARSNVADNDLAVGRLIDALSHSPFWKDTVVFINEDDPQAGFDHVDGHRSTCLVVSPYTRRGGRVVSDFFNQGSVLHTIHRIFGVPPMNQSDAASPVMASCFVNTPDFAPFTLTPNQVPLDEFPKANVALMTTYQKDILARVASIDLTEREVQTPAQMDALNRKIWHEAKGWATPYPETLAGAHGKGLAKRGLRLGTSVRFDDDDD